MIRPGSALWGLLALAAACSSSSSSAGATEESGTAETQGTTSVETSTGSGTAGSTTGGGPNEHFSCNDAAPPGAQAPPELPAFGGGACPALMPGRNVITSMGGDREFLLIVPDNIEADERLPLLFLWHWLGGDATSFLERGDVQNAANIRRFAAIIPEEKGDLTFKWPYAVIDSAARTEEEFVFFDDMLACVAEQYPVNESCISSTGVSAGALFTDQLASGRGQYLASIMSLSGGTGGLLIKPWGGAAHAMPAFVLWGGPSDVCVALDFDAASKDLEMHLEEEGHFIVECMHNCGHAEPPFDVPDAPTPFDPLWQFALDHPYWLEDGDSPWLTDGIPSDAPTWCAIGPGQATIREGECPAPEC